MPIILALLLNEVKGVKFKRINQTLLYLPHFLSWIIIGAIAYQSLSEGNGVVNNLIELMGGNRIPFLQRRYQLVVQLLGHWSLAEYGVGNYSLSCFYRKY